MRASSSSSSSPRLGPNNVGRRASTGGSSNAQPRPPSPSMSTLSGDYQLRTASTEHIPMPQGPPRYPHPYAETQERELPPLQAVGGSDEPARLDPVLEDDPASFALVAPAAGERDDYSLERRSQQLFSKDHLQVIFADSSFLLKFTSFLGIHKPQSVPALIHYLDTLKALRAIHYANAIIEGLEPVDGLNFSQQPVALTRNLALEERANAAFEVLVREELPAFITHQYVKIVTSSISSRITGSLAPHLREASEGLAEVFCLTDPSRPDNPIVFASEEFNRTTQYGMNYILGRNCRFLQGPLTNPYSVRRFRDAVTAGQPHQEVFLNYRRDGSPFMNLLMTAPLCDSRGVIRYFIGAQVDVSGLVKDCVEMESMDKLLDILAGGGRAPDNKQPNPEKADELRELAEMLNQGELSTIRRHGGKMHRDVLEEEGESSRNEPGNRLLIKDPSTLTPPIFDGVSGKLGGTYQHYLLVRPYPALRILFASPTQRVPGILQSPFLQKIGGSNRVRDELTAAFAEGRGVTAKVRWISKTNEEGRNKWIHCTPLLGGNGQVGVWMVVIVDDDKTSALDSRKWRSAPPVAGSASPGRSADRGRWNNHAGGGIKRNGVYIAINGTDGFAQPGVPNGVGGKEGEDANAVAS